MSFIVRYPDGKWDVQLSAYDLAKRLHCLEIGETADVFENDSFKPLLVCRVARQADGWVVIVEFPPNPPRVAWPNLLRSLLTELDQGDNPS